MSNPRTQPALCPGSVITFARVGEEALARGGSVVDRDVLSAVELVDAASLLHKGDEVRLDLVDVLTLPGSLRLRVLLSELLALAEVHSGVVRAQPLGFLVFVRKRYILFRVVAAR